MLLTEKYPKVIIEEQEDNKIHIKNLWDDDSFVLRFDKDDDLSFLIDLFFPRRDNGNLFS